jgi:hypothetical protein
MISISSSPAAVRNAWRGYLAPGYRHVRFASRVEHVDMSQNRVRSVISDQTGSNSSDTGASHGSTNSKISNQPRSIDAGTANGETGQTRLWSEGRKHRGGADFKAVDLRDAQGQVTCQHGYSLHPADVATCLPPVLALHDYYEGQKRSRTISSRKYDSASSTVETPASVLATAYKTDRDSWPSIMVRRRQRNNATAVLSS